MKVILTIVQVQDEYRAVVGIGAIPKIISDKKIIYQDIQDAENTAQARNVIEEMKEKAKAWARTTWAQTKEIPFIVNLDLDPYP